MHELLIKGCRLNAGLGRRSGLTIVALLACILISTAACRAGEVARTVLAVYDSRFQTNPVDTLVHKYAEMPLNHLGYRVDYHDLRRGLPDGERVKRAAGVLVWLQAGSKPPKGTRSWVRGLEGSGVRVVLFANSSSFADEDEIAPAAGDEVLAGLRSWGYFVEVTRGATVERAAPGLFSLEGPLPKPLPPFPAVSSSRAHPEDAGQTVLLEVAHQTGQRRWLSIGAAIGRLGGYIAEEFALESGGDGRQDRWLVDPFGFFALALDRPRLVPAPDVTTASGRRIFFSHVDGDGWTNPSTVERHGSRGAIAAEVFQREIIERYRDLPVTVGLIAAEVDEGPHATVHSRAVARQVLAEAHVEVGSHTYTHPYDWSFFTHYDRRRELDLVGGTARVSKSAVFGQQAGEPPVRARAPRLYTSRPFVLEHEIGGAIAVSQSLAPPGKSVKLYQWSGSTSPGETAVRLTRQSEVGNINGGDPRLDLEHHSLTNVSPVAKTVGAERQVYAAASNEFIYWGGRQDHAAFLLHREYLDRTERPRRLKPSNLYYHVYSAERDSTLGPLLRLLDLARAAEVTPIPTSDYVAMVDGFHTARIFQDGPGTWRVTNRGGIETLRFDQADGVVVDIASSRGVVGTRHVGDVLYVALDQAVEDAAVVLDRSSTTGRPGRVSMLIESRWRVQSVTTADCRLAFEARGFGSGAMTWGGLSAGAYAVSAKTRQGGSWQANVEVGSDGLLGFTVDLVAIEPVDVTVRCASLR